MNAFIEGSSSATDTVTTLPGFGVASESIIKVSGVTFLAVAMQCGVLGGSALPHSAHSVRIADVAASTAGTAQAIVSDRSALPRRITRTQMLREARASLQKYRDERAKSQELDYQEILFYEGGTE